MKFKPVVEYNYEEAQSPGIPQLRPAWADAAMSLPEKDYHHHGYVVLLSDDVARHPSILRLNPGRDPEKPCVYVGMTGLNPQERFDNHRRGHKAAWTVKKYGIRLLPELYEFLNPMPYAAAQKMEKELAADLREQGYTVTGKT